MRRLLVCLLALPMLVVSAPPASAETSTTQLIVGQNHPDEGLRLVTIPRTGGPGSNLTKDGLVHDDVAVSPNGQWVVYSNSVGDGPRQLVMRKTNGTTAPVPVASSAADEYSPAWAPDGRSVSYSRDNGSTVTICRTTVTTAGGGACTPVITSADLDDASWLDQATLVVGDFSSDDAPLAAVSLTGDVFSIEDTEGGIQPSVSPDGTLIAYLARGANADSESIKVINLNNGAVSTWPVPANRLFTTPSWTRDQVALFVVGNDDVTSAIYRVTSDSFSVVQDNAGAQFAVATVTPDATPPTNVTLGNIPAVSLAGYVSPTFSATDALNKIASYQLTFRRSSGGGYGGPTTKTLTRSTRIPLQAGYSYCFTVAATDRAGNTSAPTAAQCVMAPLDDRQLTRVGNWTQISNSSFYASTATLTGKYGQSLTRANYQGIRQLFVVARACPTCGFIDVYVGSRKVGGINTKSATAVNRKVFSVPAFSVRSGTVTLRSASNQGVVIDGLGFKK